MDKEFEFFKNIDDIHVQLRDAHGHKYRILNLDNTEIWIQYLNDGIDNNHLYSIDGSKELGGISSIMIIKKIKDRDFKIYKYKGTIQINRKIEKGVCYDFHVNILEFEKKIKENLLD